VEEDHEDGAVEAILAGGGGMVVIPFDIDRVFGRAGRFGTVSGTRF
jgi:hypothetical protein